MIEFVTQYQATLQRTQAGECLSQLTNLSTYFSDQRWYIQCISGEAHAKDNGVLGAQESR